MRNKKPHHLLFNKIAFFYGFFYKSQMKSFEAAVRNAMPVFDITRYHSVIDIGSGTGALCSVLKNFGLEVQGIEPAVRMRDVAFEKTKGLDISFMDGNVLEGLPFEDRSFDLVIASYVAHGLSLEKRKIMYQEMQRLAKEYVIFHDFNQNRSLAISFIEWLEGSDYFRFIKTARSEFTECKAGLEKCFEEVTEVKVAPQASWYICKVKRGMR